MDEWKSSNEVIHNLSTNLQGVLKAIELMIQTEVQRVDNMKATVAYIKEQQKKNEQGPK